MHFLPRHRRPAARGRALLLALTLTLGFPAHRASAQVRPPPPTGQPEATVAAGVRYHGTWLRRLVLGGTYRDLWTTPITVPVLDLDTYAGGLTAKKTGGGNQTRSLRFEDSQGRKFVFRLVDKDGLTLTPGYERTILEDMTRDQVSAHHPAGAVVADRLLTAAGIPHPTPVLMVMPDDARLGKFREEFAGRLGMIEPLPGMVEGTTGFAGALAIIDSDSLRVLLDGDPREQVEARAYLTARLMDMFLNDWDRHPGNWKWARMTPNGPWQPIPRDRDKVMIGYGGLAARAGAAIPNLVRFTGRYPSLRSLTCNSLDLDRRLLGGLDAAAFDSSAAFLGGRLTDAVIESALRAMPPEYYAATPDAAAKLRARRDLLPDQARRFHHFLAGVVDLHATDAADSAVVTLVDDRYVEVAVGSAAAPYLRCRFDARRTREIRLYLHGGDDRAVVRGRGRPPIDVRVIGGSGVNQLSDSSSSAGSSGAVRFLDQGSARGIDYGPDEVFDRRPWPQPWGVTEPPGRDFGNKTAPVLGLSIPGDLGVVFKLGLDRVGYGFRKYPYANRATVIGEYAEGPAAWRLTARFDKHYEESPLHLTTSVRMSEIEVLNYHGPGNDSPAGPDGYSEVRQRQWLLHPVVAHAFGKRTDLSFGPVVQYATSDLTTGRILGDLQPYGAADFGQAGLRLGLSSDSRNRSGNAGGGMLLDVTATVYPAVWDVASAFGVLAADVNGYHPLHVPLEPVLVLRAGGKKVLGTFPFHESAFVGGRGSVRGLERERFAGDASLRGTAELQFVVLHFALLLPWEVGVYVYGDVGRVYVDGQSPGGWHDTTGVGFWIGVLDPSTSVSIEPGDAQGRSGLRIRTGVTF